MFISAGCRPSLIIQGYRGEMLKVVGTGEMMVWLASKQSSSARLISGPHISFSKLQKQNSKEQIPASTLGKQKVCPVPNPSQL